MSFLEHPPFWARPVLGLGSAIYGAVVSTRSALYRAGVLPSARADRPVISVGNLTAGGNGKTPLVILLARKLAARGANVAVLSRGYGAPSPPKRATIAAKNGAFLAPVEVAGDEPLLISRKAGASVVIARRRAEAAKLAVEVLMADVLLLDDGFQHHALQRDLDLVLVDAAKPFDNGWLIPNGRLRERPSALSRADLIVAHRGDAAAPIAVDGVDAPLEMVVAPDRLIRGDETRELRSLAGAKVGLIAAIARPERFVKTVELLGAEIVSRSWFPDHATPSPEQLAAARAEASNRGAELLITTEKDAIKVPGLWTLSIEARLIRGEDLLDAALDRLLGGAR